MRVTSGHRSRSFEAAVFLVEPHHRETEPIKRLPSERIRWTRRWPFPERGAIRCLDSEDGAGRPEKNSNKALHARKLIAGSERRTASSFSWGKEAKLGVWTGVPREIPQAACPVRPACLLSFLSRRASVCFGCQGRKRLQPIPGRTERDASRATGRALRRPREEFRECRGKSTGNGGGRTGPARELGGPEAFPGQICPLERPRPVAGQGLAM
ncbi:uncharacterized protein LOC143827430 isoform X2 [Paroedura picta]|uniref:uncharacterized protein LOC143827430 isoform X2 n=1 Tax=Paroedura picta TaxID=143630 RepID=UPI004057888E